MIKHPRQDTKEPLAIQFVSVKSDCDSHPVLDFPSELVCSEVPRFSINAGRIRKYLCCPIIIIIINSILSTFIFSALFQIISQNNILKSKLMLSKSPKTSLSSSSPPSLPSCLSSYSTSNVINSASVGWSYGRPFQRPTVDTKR